MSKMVIDEATQQKLGGIHQSTILYDSVGNIVGMFTPVSSLNEPPYLSDEEVERRATSEKCYSTEEALKYLRSLK